MSLISTALQSVYGTTEQIGKHLDTVVSDMKKADNPAVARTGHVIESAKLGFCIGYTTPIVIVALGQMILGHPLQAVASAAAMAVNPFAITCAAVGAIYYGWTALSDEERDAIVARLSAGLEVGTELVRSIAVYVIKLIKELSSPELIQGMKTSLMQGMEACADKLGELTNAVRNQFSAVYTSIATDDKNRLPSSHVSTEQKALQQKLTQLIAADREGASVSADRG